MQTFLPFPDFEASAKVLDRQRLGKQRVETLQIVHALSGTSSGWRNHPAVRMWRGYELALIKYGLVICAEWVGRGYKDSVTEKLMAYTSGRVSSVPMPPWHGHEPFHVSHQSNLLRKDFHHYKDHFPGVTPDLPYVWPVCDVCVTPTDGATLCPRVECHRVWEEANT